MIFVEPEKRIADQKIAHFAATEIKNERAPILMLALTRVQVLIEIGAVKFRERVRVFREMRRHPIHDHTDAGLVTLVDEVTQSIGRPKTARRRIIIRDLITPRAFKGMLGNRHQLNVRVTHLDDVGQQRLGKFQIAQMPVALIGATPP